MGPAFGGLFFFSTFFFGIPIIQMTDTNNNLKYILPWTYDEANNYDWLDMGFPANGGQQGFLDRKCLYNNCYVTSDRSYLDNDYTKFNALVFMGKELIGTNIEALPALRSPHQKYVFATIEAADNYPICDEYFNNYFNWTWTYRLDSDARVPYFFVKDNQNRIIGPRKLMHWIDLDDMEGVSEELREILSTKRKAVAWFVSDCETRSRREDFVEALNMKLREFGLSVDIYGFCGDLKCYEEGNGECLKMISRDYYFYLAFENSFSEDYVTEKVLHALQNDAVPIVFGGADYSMFLPDGSYLNARELGVEKLATIMNNLIQNPGKYYNYFRWRNHYSFHEVYDSPLMDGFCRLCEMLNDEIFMSTTIYKRFTDWWNVPGRCPTKKDDYKYAGIYNEIRSMLKW